MLTDWRIAAAAAIFCTGILMTCIETNAQSVQGDCLAHRDLRDPVADIVRPAISQWRRQRRQAGHRRRRIAHRARHRSPPGRGDDARLGRRLADHRSLGAPIQRDGNLDLRDRRIFRPWADDGQHQPGAARPAELHPRYLPLARTSGQAPARRSGPHRAVATFCASCSSWARSPRYPGGRSASAPCVRGSGGVQRNPC